MNKTSKDKKDILRSILPLLKGDSSWDLGDVTFPETGNIWVLGAGKASVQMAEAVLEEKFNRVKDGIIISPTEDYLDTIQIFRGSHPYPDIETVSASYELREVARRIPTGDTVVFCLSGGASSLLAIPPYGIEVEELAATYEILLESGAPIQEMNIVRKHLCELKGGQLAEELRHTNLITLIISDVPGDVFSTIGSGPTIPDPSTFKEAVAILKTYNLWGKLPQSVRIHFELGHAGDIPDTPKPGIDDHPNHQIYLLNSAQAFASTVKSHLEEAGLHCWVADEAYDEDINVVTKKMCSKAISVLRGDEGINKPTALIYFGESTVNVKGNGKGGRNQHLALSCALALEGQHDVTMLSIGTDGIDGPTDAAGAIIDSYTTLKARKAKLEPEKFLQDNDSYHFHEKMDTLIRIGPTGNNLMDLQVLIIN